MREFTLITNAIGAEWTQRQSWTPDDAQQCSDWAHAAVARGEDIIVKQHGDIITLSELPEPSPGTEGHVESYEHYGQSQAVRIESGDIITITVGDYVLGDFPGNPIAGYVTGFNSKDGDPILNLVGHKWLYARQVTQHGYRVA